MSRKDTSRRLAQKPSEHADPYRSDPAREEGAAAIDARCICLSPGLGIALAGGGGRGIAQIGVLKVLESEGISVEYVAGTSIGAIIGGLYALTGRAVEVEKRVLQYLRRQEETGRPSFFGSFRALARRTGPDVDHSVVDRLRYLWALGRGLSSPSMGEARDLRAILEELFGAQTFAETRIPFATTAVDLNSGRRLVFAAGSLVDAIYASAALPGIVPPLELEGYRLIDGGFAEPVPVDTCRYLGAAHVLAVDVLGRPATARELDSSLAVIMRADQVARHALEREHLAKAEVIVMPEVESIDWTDFSHPEERIAAGERAARQKLPEIRALISRFEQVFVRGMVMSRPCEPERSSGANAVW
ncbi:MAG: hypothetical protein GWN32_15825 [Gemmatimonadetes bacterium]|nr:hypothetical protein [Gemmatimonadota bacterium]